MKEFKNLTIMLGGYSTNIDSMTIYKNLNQPPTVSISKTRGFEDTSFRLLKEVVIVKDKSK